MANPLLDPNKWGDPYNTPPSSWNAGSNRYEILNPYGVNYVISNNFAFGLNLPKIDAGDIVSFTFEVVAADTRDPGAAVIVAIDGAIVYTQDVTVIGVGSFTSDSLKAEAEVEIYFDNHGYGVYSGDFILTPTAPSATGFWTDFVGCLEE